MAKPRVWDHVRRYLDQAYRLGEKPVTPAIVKTRAPDMHDLEPTLTRYGYNVKALAELLNIRPAAGGAPWGSRAPFRHRLQSAVNFLSAQGCFT